MSWPIRRCGCTVMSAAIDVRRCRYDEIPHVMDFIHRHWQSSHALAVSRELMNWQHGAADGSCDYLIAVRGPNEILGVLGYIASRRFDPALVAHNVMWLALWKVLEAAGVAGLGLRMLNVLVKLDPHITLGVNGINAAHPPMYKALRFQTGELKRYYVTSPGASFKLLQTPKGGSEGLLNKLPVPLSGRSRFTEMTAEDLAALDSSQIAVNAANPKSPAYFATRFLRHPFYRYRVFLIEGPDHGPALLASRIAQHESARALRIVDFAGDPAAIASMGSAIKALLQEEGAEFADFWELGLPDEYFASAGFTLLDPDGPVVLPAYFEPFNARNGRMLYALRTSAPGPAVICRADGDQDRPNRLPIQTSEGQSA
jgi:hypothetical protein